MPRLWILVGLSCLSIGLTAGCEDVKNEFRRLKGKTEEAVLTSAARPEIDALCERAREDTSLTFEELMEWWKPTSDSAKNVKYALEAGTPDMRYPLLVRGTGEEDWSCPELEAALPR